eukprot:TRINITY_DN52088_c0_g1_i1.p1 TRINITY_DN52088_c0_g1~~TRINITY_DN52088_c0_g1_i1.p1  ORF type:complete len:394 (-),score=56.17 TRINITY_DN52088_c0_g1_i1:36-1217(-)
MPAAIDAALGTVPPEGCIVQLQGLSREELNGLRGVCLGQSREQEAKQRVGVRLDDGRELSIACANAASLVSFEDLPGKGIGGIARLPLGPGALVVREPPALLGRLGTQPDKKQFRSLPPAKQRAVFDLCDAYVESGAEEKTLEGIVATNGLPRGSRAEETVLCLLASRFNHSCAPNAEYLWVEDRKMEEVRTVRAVAPGEEICVNYFGDAVQLPRSARQAQLREGFRFDCRCPVCIAADPNSDHRREKLSKLGQEILSCRDTPERGLRIAEEMLEILQQESISAPRTVAQVCNDGFELSLLNGDKSDIQYWAHMSYEAHRLGWGESHEMTRRMRHYSQHPPSLASRSDSKAKPASAIAAVSTTEATAGTKDVDRNGAGQDGLAGGDSHLASLD